jgi:hypothetical protein
VVEAREAEEVLENLFRFSVLILDFIEECGTDKTFFKASSKLAYSPASFSPERLR